jgi:hypothetical protein
MARQLYKKTKKNFPHSVTSSEAEEEKTKNCTHVKINI